MRLVGMRLVALGLVLLSAACSASKQEIADSRPAAGKQEAQIDHIGAPTFAPGVLEVGDVVKCGHDGVAAAVPARGEGVNVVFDGLKSSTIDIVHEKNGVVVVRCSL